MHAPYSLPLLLLLFFISHAEVLEQGPSPALCSSGLRQDPSEAVIVRKTKRIQAVMVEIYQKWPLHCGGTEEHLRKSQGDETILWWWQRARDMDIHHGYKTYHVDTPEYKDLGTAIPPWDSIAKSQPATELKQLIFLNSFFVVERSPEKRPRCFEVSAEIIAKDSWQKIMGK